MANCKFGDCHIAAVARSSSCVPIQRRRRRRRRRRLPWIAKIGGRLVGRPVIRLCADSNWRGTIHKSVAFRTPIVSRAELRFHSINSIQSIGESERSLGELHLPVPAACLTTNLASCWRRRVVFLGSGSGSNPIRSGSIRRDVTGRRRRSLPKGAEASPLWIDTPSCATFAAGKRHASPAHLPATAAPQRPRGRGGGTTTTTTRRRNNNARWRKKGAPRPQSVSSPLERDRGKRGAFKEPSRAWDNPASCSRAARRRHCTRAAFFGRWEDDVTAPSAHLSRQPFGGFPLSGRDAPHV